MAALVLIAGVDTTWSAIGSSLWHLATHPDDRQRMVTEPGAHGPCHRGAAAGLFTGDHGAGGDRGRRVPGCPMKAGDKVLMNFPAANRDPDGLRRCRQGHAGPANSTAMWPSVRVSTGVPALTWPVWSSGSRWRSGCVVSPSSALPTAPRSPGPAARSVGPATVCRWCSHEDPGRSGEMPGSCPLLRPGARAFDVDDYGLSTVVGDGTVAELEDRPGWPSPTAPSAMRGDLAEAFAD